MAKKRKAAKKLAKVKAQKPVKKSVKTSVKKAAKKAVQKKPVKKSARKLPRGAVRVASAIEGVYVPADAALQGRLRALATGMQKPLNEILAQALTEFANNWEDHMQTVEALNSDDDRVQLAVKPEGSTS